MPRPLPLALGFIVALQAVLLGFVLWMFKDTPPQALEERPLVKSDPVVVRREFLVDCIHQFSGTELAPDDADMSTLRRQLLPDRGQFSWILLQDKVEPNDALPRLLTAARTLPGKPPPASDLPGPGGVLKFFYDLGARPDLANWSAVGLPELQMSPLLSWTKRVDFIALSCFDADHTGGLDAYARLGLRAPFLVPAAHPREDGRTARLRRRLVWRAEIGPGWHPLTDRLGAYVYESAPAPATPGRHYVLVLLLRGPHGWTLLNGSDGLAPDVLLERVERAAGFHIRTLAGATGFGNGSRDARLTARLRAFHQRHPELIMAPSYATSPAAHESILEAFGDDHYRPGVLGGRWTL